MERIFISRIIHADPDTIWTIVREFNGLPNWHPAIADSMIESGRAADAVGSVRSFHLTDGGHIREQLTELSDSDRHMRYIILESPMPISNYASNIKVIPATENAASLVVWEAEFEVSPAADTAAAVATVADGVFRAGLEALVQKLS